MLIWGFLHSALPGFYRGKQDSLLFWPLFFLLFALRHRAKIPQWQCLTFFCP